jgi:hypothetical protein
MPSSRISPIAEIAEQAPSKAAGGLLSVDGKKVAAAG